jgi:hypothetical protein
LENSVFSPAFSAPVRAVASHDAWPTKQEIRWRFKQTARSFTRRKTIRQRSKNTAFASIAPEVWSAIILAAKVPT